MGGSILGNIPGHQRRGRTAARAVVAVTAALVAVVIAGCTGGSPASQPGRSGSAPVGIVDPQGVEQAPVLAAMQVDRSLVVDGYRFWIGTMGGSPVVDVGSGEIDESVELATYLLDTTFHPRLVVLSGTAGAQNAAVNVGDVVLGGFVVDKSSVHYQDGGHQSPYYGVEIHQTGDSDLQGAVVDRQGKGYPDPANAKAFGSGPSTPDTQWTFVNALAASRQALTVAERAGGSLGAVRTAVATGVPQAGGSVPNKVVSGVIGQADVWTEPLSWLAAQNALYQTDAEENEGTGFAFSNAEQGVPWLIVRGISDTPWHPGASDAVLGSQHAAGVVRYLVGHLRGQVARAPATLADLAPVANARVAGYLVATQAYYGVGPVTQVQYVDPGGRTVTLAGPQLAALQAEYTYAASKLG